MNDTYPISTLTKEIANDHRGAHIFYAFSDIDKYVENATNFIYEGITKGDFVLLIATKLLNKQITERLATKGLTIDQINSITVLDTNKYYLDGKQFSALKASRNLIDVVQPYIDEGQMIRTWGQIPIHNENMNIEQLRLYECSCNDYIAFHKTISVCTYDGFATPATIQNELLKTHTHFMTDDEYMLSPFYDKKHHKSLPPEELHRLRKLEQQNQYLRNKNDDLLSENNYVKFKNEVIKQNEIVLRTIINELPIPIIIRNESSGLFFNNVAKEHFNINNKNILKMKNLAPFFENFNINIDSEKQIQEHQFTHFNGKKKFYLVKSIDILFESEDAILHAFIDITQEKENENLVIRSEKMNIAGELAASIAHEIRNPLAAIKGFFQLLKTSEQKDLYFNVIDNELSRIEQISSELLTLAKPHSEDRKVYNIIQLINEVKLLLTSQANMRSIEINLHTDNKEIYVICEATKIKQVFINMIKNSIDAMEHPGNVFLVVKGLEDSVQIEIIDEGCGIPEELKSKIGEPFYTTKEKGTGIGLMVCYQIIESHAGTIHLDSKVGKGTKFTITLPLFKKNGTINN